jgi:hypothetical protein
LNAEVGIIASELVGTRIVLRFRGKGAAKPARAAMI